nr:F-box protein CPR1-like [Populus alba]
MHLQKLTQARTNLGLILGDRSSTRLYPVNLDKPNPTSSMELIWAYLASGKEYDKFCWERTLYGFGYDPINEDYKVVKIVDYNGNTINRCFFSEVKVYSLMKSNSWKRIKGYPNYYAIFQPEYHRANKGEYIWIIAKPADYLANEHHYFDLGVLGGTLGVIKLCTVVSELRVVDRFYFNVRALAYSKSEDKVLLELDNTFFCLV